MAILNISPNQFRNLAVAEVVFDPRMNIVIGENASGKTSLLEAVYFLLTGRSFRSHKVENIIANKSAERSFILYGQTRVEGEVNRNCSIGIKKSVTGKSIIKVDQQIIQSASELVKISPVIIIDPSSFELLVGGPGTRRKFMDWGVFHVEHSFSKRWSEYNYCLKQRNTLLRAVKLDLSQLKVWDHRLAILGEEIHQYRSSYAEELEVIFKEMARDFLLDEQLKLYYARGWDKDLSFEQILAKYTDRDHERRYTRYGPHRADLKLTINGTPVQDILSRGQQKLLIIAMYLSQIEYLRRKTSRRSVVLVDDIAAELDSANLSKVFCKLAALNAQVICTALNLDDVQRQLIDNETFKVFHVEHGKIAS